MMLLPDFLTMGPRWSVRITTSVRFDLISIFPAYFEPLGLSLMGKAKEAGLVTLVVHDLRAWASGKHRSVDDTPYGGGAGMVMRADVWGAGLDEVLGAQVAQGREHGGGAPRRVLAIPTPSGEPLRQAMVEDLARADQIVVACGRYEGIDARVAQHYRSRGVEVLEFSIGDYVLNGGEVAAMVLTEAVARLLDGFMGNPDSLVEESHSGAGLLEYPVYTKPRVFRGLAIPEVLVSGNHAAIERWRRDRAIEKTARVRPDLALALDAQSLGEDDRATLAASGIGYPRDCDPKPVTIRRAVPGDSEKLDALVSRGLPALGSGTVRAALGDGAHNRILLAHVEADCIAYVHIRVGDDALPADLVRPGRVNAGSAYLCGSWVEAAWRDSGVYDALVNLAVKEAAHAGHDSLTLVTNRADKPAQALYRRLGFRKRATRRGAGGHSRSDDVVMVRDLTDAVVPTLAEADPSVK